MAIAPLDLDPGYGALEVPWPRPALRLVAPTGDGWDDGDADADDDDDDLDGPEWEDPPPAAWLAPGGSRAVRGGIDLSTRRRRRRQMVRRRRRVLAVGGVVALAVVLLALPLRALGGAAVAPRSAAPGAGTIYVVQPGDTEWSIASRFDHGGDPRTLAVSIARETGSDVVVPGERVAIP